MSYNRSSFEVRSRIIEIFNSGGDWKSAAAHNGVKYKTAYRWVRSGNPEQQQRGGLRESRRKISNVHVDAMITWIEEDCTITLKSIKERLYQDFDVTFSLQCLSEHLNAQLFTYKCVHVQPISANSDNNKQKRKEFVEQLLNYQSEEKIIVYMDETNVNLFCKRSYGRAIRGNRARRMDGNCRGPNLHIIAAVSIHGLIHWERKRGAFKNEDANSWLRRMLQSCQSRNLSNVVIVCDNAPCHSRFLEVTQEEAFKDMCVLLKLGPYSPMLNPTENLWSAMKSKVKTSLAANQASILQDHTASQMTQGEYRMQRLEQIVDMSMAEMTTDLCIRSCNHVQKFFARALRMEDMPVGE